MNTLAVHDVKEDFLPVLLSDFSTKMVVKFSGNRLSDEDKEKIKKFMQMVTKSDIRSVEGEVMRKIDNLKEGVNNEDINVKMEAIKKVVSDVGEGYKIRMSQITLPI